MKRIIASALIIMLTIGAAKAQTTSEGNRKGHNKEHKMGTDKMNLTADQKARLQTIRQEYKKESEALKNNTALSAQEKQTRRKNLHDQYRSQSRGVLTPAQREQQAKIKEDFKASHKDEKGKFNKGKEKMNNDGKARGKGMERGKDMQKELGLTADQQAKVYSIRTSFKPKFEALRNDTSLTEEQKRAKMKELMKQQQEQMKAVLTAEQIQKMEASRQQYSKRKNK